jgi:hypothetical protein
VLSIQNSSKAGDFDKVILVARFHWSGSLLRCVSLRYVREEGEMP